MQVSGLHHLNIRTTPEKLEETREFYEYYMDLKVGPRPDFPFGGYWMYVGKHPLVHISIREPKGMGAGAANDYGFGHIAFDCKGFDTLKEKLDTKGVDYQERPTPDNKLIQVFFDDPNGVLVEMVFDIAETQSAAAE
jgi:catechol 2,3-dioxygenase-like lactoylglutathione lyase family enzyme